VPLPPSLTRLVVEAANSCYIIFFYLEAVPNKAPFILKYLHLPAEGMVSALFELLEASCLPLLESLRMVGFERDKRLEYSWIPTQLAVLPNLTLFVFN
jgi:hypothetical protein